MSITVREYQAGKRLSQLAGDLRSSMGANEFYSLLSAIMRFAGSEELDKLEEVFPEAVENMKRRYNSPMGLQPGEFLVQEKTVYRMNLDGTVSVEER